MSAVGAYTFFVSWQPPSQPNGGVRRYELHYAAGYELDTDLRTLYVSASTLNTSVSGVRPYMSHAVRVRAVNSAGSVVSAWTNFTTLEAAPSQLGTMSIGRLDIAFKH